MAASMVGRGIATNLFDKLLRRNLVGGIYPESALYRMKLKEMLERPTAVYSGFDPTASSLHVGNLAVIMNLLHFQSHGHQVICVIGDATAQIGDPSGHFTDRDQIEESVIEKNAESIEEILHRIFKNYNRYFSPKGSKEPVIVRNSTWYNDKNFIQFIKHLFRPFRVAGLLHKKSISERLDQVNLLEFCYQTLQAYDWLELRRQYDCRLQLGGADQGGNIYTGHDFIKKMLDDRDSIGLLCPLITNKKGKKLGKTTSNKSNIWLRSELTSPYDLYQFFHQTPDSEVEKLLNVFSLYDEETIEKMIKNDLKNPKDIWFCQRKLAEHVCLLVHGEVGLDDAKRKTKAVFNKD